MSTNLTAPPRAYRQTAVMTASPEQLVVMLYDGALRFLHQSGVAMRGRQIELTHRKLRRAEDIIEHLRGTLDHEQGAEIATSLENIYVFCLQHLNEARLTQDPTKVEEVSRLLAQLREAWEAIARR